MDSEVPRYIVTVKAEALEFEEAQLIRERFENWIRDMGLRPDNPDVKLLSSHIVRFDKLVSK